jgi:uncharacterized protein YkwD
MGHWPGWFGVVVVLGMPWLIQEGSAQTKDKTEVALSAKEQELLDLTNQERKKEGLAPLRPNPVLVKVARAHAVNMAKQQKPEHVLDNKTPYQRIKEAGYRYYVAGENVAAGETDVEDTFKGWMASPGHRANILDRKYTEIGLGLGRDDKGWVYYTQLFATPAKKR